MAFHQTMSRIESATWLVSPFFFYLRPFSFVLRSSALLAFQRAERRQTRCHIDLLSGQRDTAGYEAARKRENTQLSLHPSLAARLLPLKLIWMTAGSLCRCSFIRCHWEQTDFCILLLRPEEKSFRHQPHPTALPPPHLNSTQWFMQHKQYTEKKTTTLYSAIQLCSPMTYSLGGFISQSGQARRNDTTLSFVILIS